jgi:hypothetical protein
MTSPTRWTDTTIAVRLSSPARRRRGNGTAGTGCSRCRCRTARSAGWSAGPDSR